MCFGRAAIALLLAAALTCPASTAGEPEPVPEPENYWVGPINGPVPATLRGAHVIDARALARLIARGGALIVDVSNLPRRPEGLSDDVLWDPPPHLGIPGSHWIPGVGLGVLPASADEHFRHALVALTGENRDRPLAIYCHERCWLSWNAAKRAVAYGYRSTYWFPGGIEGWRAAGYRTAVLSATPGP
jgi:PQQ-dependent catabolism-associated CXXCW motif protein